MLAFGKALGGRGARWGACPPVTCSPGERPVDGCDNWEGEGETLLKKSQLLSFWFLSTRDMLKRVHVKSMCSLAICANFQSSPPGGGRVVNKQKSV